MQQDLCEVPRWQLLKQQLNNLSPQQFLQAIADAPNAIVIDVRTPEEFAFGHLDRAINIDYLGEGFWEKMEALDPAKNYFVYCRTSRRSVRTCTLMRNGGFANVFHLDGGWNALTEAELVP